MIEAQRLTKHYGATAAVQDLTFTVRPGVVTGFLGPNGAGKSTTMRLILGLDRRTGGSVTVNGRDYASLRAPLTEVGALLEARSVHPGRSAYSHLRALAATHGIGARRVREVVGLVGLDDVAGRRVGAFSLGMGQRLGLAVALLGDPGVLLLDEPVNGLDPEGIRWIRGLLRELAGQGRTVFVSSHLMSEMAQTAEHLIVIGRGRLIADTSVAQVIAQASRSTVRVVSPRLADLLALLPDSAVTARQRDTVAEVEGVSAAQLGELAAAHRIVLHELTPMQASLEEAFMELTRDSVDFHGHNPDAPAAQVPA